ncbi:MAG: putative inorganic carbon transporter subunit DabA, partial [Pseudomonadota bacterium]
MTSAKANFGSVRSLLEHIAHLLPTQGPIDVFIHHNTLHAFEHLPFEQAVEQAAKVYGAEAYLPEQRYLEEHGQGRITERDLDAVLSEVFEDNQALPGFSLREVVKRFLVIAPPVEGFQEVK